MDGITYVHTAGDSSINNDLWVPPPAEKNNVEGQLAALLNPAGEDARYEVVGHACDLFTTKSLNETDPEGLGSRARGYFLAREADGSGIHQKVSPMTHLTEAVDSAPKSKHRVILSVGGNDFRLNLADPIAFIRDIPAIRRRYLAIVDQIKALGNGNVRPILMLQYQPDTTNDRRYQVYRLLGGLGAVATAVHGVCASVLGVTVAGLVAGKVRSPAVMAIAAVAGLAWFGIHRVFPANLAVDVVTGKKQAGVALIGQLMQRFYAPIVEQAKRDRIPILDLPNTMNPFDGSLYSHQIEPNERGGAIIAEGIAHIVRNHDFEGASCLYAKPSADDAYSSRPNLGGDKWRVAYPATV